MSNFYTPDGAAMASKRMEWRTPPMLFKKLDTEFHFTLDAAASRANALCPRFLSAEGMDAFSTPWTGRVFCNPPYGRDAGRWIARIAHEAATSADIVVALLPARTDTAAFHTYLYNRPGVSLRFLRGRLRFGDPDTGLPGDPAPFPSMIAIVKKP